LLNHVKLKVPTVSTHGRVQLSYWFAEDAWGNSGQSAPLSIHTRKRVTSCSGSLWLAAIGISVRRPRTMSINGLSALLPITIKAGFFPLNDRDPSNQCKKAQDCDKGQQRD
jgi:hypothetical protein